MKPDRELLEAAAKACGYVAEWYPNGKCDLVTRQSIGDVIQCNWNPITNTADRYELCKKLGLTLDFNEKFVVGIDGSSADWTNDEDEGRVIVEFAGRVG